DVPLEVQPPRLHRAGRVPDAAEGNGELGAPANVAGLRTHDPRGVPVQVEATARTGLLVEAGPRAAAAAHHARALTLVCDLPVVLEPGRVGAEHEAVLPVLVRVDDDLEAVDVGEGRITPRIAEHDPARLRVVADDAEVQRAVGVHDADLGLLRGGLAFEGRNLYESNRRLGVLPRRIVQHLSVECRGLG